MRPRNAALRRLALLALVLLGLYGCASEAVSWYNKGVRTDALDDKIYSYTKAIELNPKYAFAYTNRGNAYNKKGLYAKAIADLTKAIDLLNITGDKHNLPLAYNNRGNTYHFKGQYDRAIRNYTEAILHNPLYGLAFFNRGLSYYKKGQYDRAIRDYTEALHRHVNFKSGYAPVYTNRGNAYSEKGLYYKAIADLNIAVGLFKKQGDKRRLVIAYNDRGIAHRKRGKLDRAIRDFTKATELEPSDAHAYSHLAWVYATSPDAVYRNGKRALEFAERAVKLERVAHNLDALSAAYAEMGRFEDAIRTQLLAIALLKKETDNRYMADFERHLERYRTHKPWRIPAGP